MTIILEVQLFLYFSGGVGWWTHYDLKRLKNGKNPKQISFSRIFLVLQFYLSRFLSSHRKCRKSDFSGSEWLDGSKMTCFDSKMHIFAIFWWF